jgi:glycosyltransferase involved in cell wall biosynthesis
VPPGDADALRATLDALLRDPQARAEMSRRAIEAGQGELSWDSVARRTLELYGSLVG